MRKIETRGFKSLGSKLISTPVEQGFVAITGPNGSGKSNLLDAVLFALGENSAKSLRVPNLSGLIFDGSIEEQKPSSAKVTLQFDNSDRRIPFDSDTLSISRELKQNGESLYFLNGKHTQRNILSDLLENALITSRGLNIVLQGMITRIADLAPDDKRKLIEQMVGIAQFDEKKDQALSQLKEADVKLEVAMAKIGEIRDRVQLLEQQRNDMLRVRQLEEQITWLRAAASSAKLVNVRKMLEQRREALAVYDSKTSNLLGQLTDVLRSISETESKRSELIKSAVHSGTAKIEADLGRVSNELANLKRERQEANDYLDRTKQVIPALTKIIDENKKKIVEKESEVSSLNEKIHLAHARKSEIELEQTKLSDSRADFEKEFNLAQEEIGAVRREKDEEERRLQAAQEHYGRTVSELKLEEENLKGIKEKISFYTEGSKETENKLFEIESVLSDERKELGEIKESKHRIELLKHRVEKQLDIASLVLERTSGAVTKFDSDMSALENVAGEEIALSRLESLGGTSAIRGYLGTIRSLVSYNPRYAQALAAIGREWLNAVVVEDMDSLIRTAESSKKLKITRLILIPLSEITSLAHVRKERFNSIRGLITPVSQIVRAEKKFQKIVNFIFGDAVIVDSPRNAFIAARKGFRAVTLQGDLFEPEVLAFETGYSKRYAKISELLSKQQGFKNIKEILDGLRSLIEKRKISLSKLEHSATNFGMEEQTRNIDISKIEASLDTSRAYLERYAQFSGQLELKQNRSENQTLILQKSALAKLQELEEQKGLVRKAQLRLDGMDLSAFNQKLTGISKKEHEVNGAIESVAREIRELTTEEIRARAELENGLKPALEHSLQQLSSIETNLKSKGEFLEKTSEKFGQLSVAYEKLKEEEAKSIERSSRFQPVLDSLEQILKSQRSEEEALRRAHASSERDIVAANLDANRMQESERQLLGELAIYGYAEPIEGFEGAEQLLKGLNDEYDLLRNNVNLIADKNYREIFENYKYSSVRKNDLEKERNAIVLFIETIDSEKRRVFLDAFERIDRELRVIFTKITDGAGWLEIENQDAMFDSGIFLMTQFPGKLPRDSGSVSGGEKTISALSFILAIQAVFPSPFYVFDEVDAHLDSRYSGRLADILAERSDRSQIIIVSLKDNVVAKAGSVIGVYMSQGSSKIIRYRSPMEVPVPNEQQ